MQFRLAKTYRYWWPVTVQIPDPETPGKIIVQDLKVQLEPMTQAEINAAQEDAAKLKTLRAVTDHGVRQMLRVVKNWDGVVDEEGQPVPFSAAALEQALQHAWFRTGVNRAILDSQNGEEARQGN